MKTFSEVKKALKLYIDSYDLCTYCPYYVKNIEQCTQNLTNDIIEIIKEYERLLNENNK